MTDIHAEKMLRACSALEQVIARPFAQFAWLVFALPLALAGCAGPPVESPAELNRAYEEVLQRTAPPQSALFVAGSAEEQAALERLRAYFAQMTSESVRAQTTAVYAPDAWLYDNLAIVSGADEIERYFLGSLANARGLSVEFLQVLQDGPDYFVRWRMSVDVPSLNDGQPIVSYGMTQFRFDAEGRVLVHRDFWDAATGIYEYLPGLGGLVRRARSALASHGEEPNN